jgi:uncharacterized protein (TIGR02145 family)
MKTDIKYFSKMPDHVIVSGNKLILTRMSKITILTILMLCSVILFGQNLNMTFTATGVATAIDSVKATNLRTNQSVSLPGHETLMLSFNTGINSFSEISRTGNVFPNPFQGKTTFVVYIEKSQAVTLEVRNIVGQVVAQTQTMVQRGTHSFAIALSRAGIYLVSLSTNKGKEGYKVVCNETSEASDRIFYSGMVDDYAWIPNFKNITVYTLDYTSGDIILYRCRSGVHTTIVTDSPAESKNYEVEFAVCADPDGKNYAIVKINTQTWMAENLAYLPEVSASSTGSDSLKNYYVYDYEDTLVANAKNTFNYKSYGVLYNWPAAMSNDGKTLSGSGRLQAVCPAGWHLPDDGEWKILEENLGMNAQDADTIYLRNSGEVGKKLKSSVNWINGGNGSNSGGFTALPGGYRNTHGGFRSIDNYALFWSAGQSDTTTWYRSLNFNDNGVYRFNTLKSHGLSVRCVKDSF